MSLRFPEPLKTTSQKTSKQGIKSGKRSAIFRHEGACYRLKGCKKAEERFDDLFSFCSHI